MLTTLRPTRAEPHDTCGLHGRLDRALATTSSALLRSCLDVTPDGEQDELLSLLLLLDLSLAPLQQLGGRERFHTDPAATELRQRLATALLDRVRSRCRSLRAELADGVTGMRSVAVASAHVAAVRAEGAQMSNTSGSRSGDEPGSAAEGDVSDESPPQAEPAEGRRDDDLPPGAQLTGEPPLDR